MDYELISKTSEVLGTLSIAFAALRVHHRVQNEHKIDKHVISAMRKERIIGITGTVLIVIGYLIDILL